MTNSWMLLKTAAQSQPRYISQVAEYHPSIPFFIPQYRKLCRPHGKRIAILITRPVYPGYIFVKPDFNTGEHHQLTRLPTKAYFVRFGRELSLIPDRVIDELRRLESLHQYILEDQNDVKYYPGQKIRIAFPTIDVIATLIHIISGNKVLADSPIGRVTAPLAQCAPLPTP